MSLNGIFNIAQSGVLAAQTQLRTVSDNVSNLSTPGYIRKLAAGVSQVSDGVGSGVAVARLRLATDRYLQAAGLRATSAQAAAQTSADVLDRAQALFGDPTSGGDLFASVDQAFAAFSKLSIDASASARGAPLADLAALFSQAQGVGAGLARLSQEADEQLGSKVEDANALLKQIDALNAEISRGSTAGRDVTGSQNQQSGLIDQLSALMDVRVTPRALGGVTVRAADGLPLAGEGGGPATLSYDGDGPTGQLSVKLGDGPPQALGGRLTSGSLAGLLKLRNTDLPGVTDQLATLTSGVAASLNAAHNAHSAAPPPPLLSGRATALSAGEAFAGFTTGRTEVAVTDATGAVTRRVDVDWGAGVMSVDGGAPAAFTPATFASSLNTALGAFGSASFDARGVLKLAATSGGVAVADDPVAPTLRAGKSFSGFFGLNDLVTSPASDGATGLAATDASGFSGAITLRIGDAAGARIKDVAVTLPAAPATMADVLAALNSPTTGAGLYGGFALDADGRLAFTPKPGTGATLDVVKDTTARGGAGGPSLSGMFGLGSAARGARLGGFAVRADILADPSRLALATVRTDAAVGVRAVSAADVSGADALGQAGKTRLGFAAAGGLAGGVLDVSDYAAKVSASVARRADAAQSAQKDAEAVATDASARRASVEGVNLDQELIDLTTYQQAYNASARLVSAARDLYDVLLNMVGP